METKERSLKEFMEWFVEEYDGNWIPSELDHTIDRLEGYCIAKDDSKEYFFLASSLEMLKNFKTILERIKSESNWKYK
jgi:hypothetical protein